MSVERAEKDSDLVGNTMLSTWDIVTVFIYFLLVMAAGFYVSYLELFFEDLCCTSHVSIIPKTILELTPQTFASYPCLSLSFILTIE